MGGNRKRRGKAAITVMLLFAAAILSAAWAMAGGIPDRNRLAGEAGNGPAYIRPDYVRIQVVANSDSESDQHVKATVRDLLRNRLGEAALNLASADDALAYAAASLPELKAAVGCVLAEESCGYDCALTVGVMAFPAKSYGGVVVPPGEYPALRVALGQAKGTNWWCVLFPPLCFVDVGTSLARDPAVAGTQAPLDDEILEAVRTALEQAEPGGSGADGGGSLRMRSWLLERLGDSRWWARLWQSLKTRLAAGMADE